MPAIVIVLACAGCCSVESHVTVRVSVAAPEEVEVGEAVGAEDVLVVALAEVDVLAEALVVLALSAKEGRGSSKHARAALTTVTASFFVRFMDVSLLLRSATRAALIVALVFVVSNGIVVFVVVDDFF